MATSALSSMAFSPVGVKSARLRSRKYRKTAAAMRLLPSRKLWSFTTK